MIRLKIVDDIPRRARDEEPVAIDIEMFGQDVNKLHRPHGEFACISVMYQDEDIVYQVHDTAKIPAVLDAVVDGSMTLVNALYDFRQLSRWDKNGALSGYVPYKIWDCMLVEQNLFGGYYRDFSMADMVRRYYDVKIDKGIRGQFSDATRMTDEMKQYAAEDVYWTLKIRDAQRNLGRDMKNYWQVDQPMIWTLLNILPVKIDVEKWTNTAQEFDRIAKETELTLGINVKSVPQVKKALLDEGIRVNDTRAETLDALAGRSKIVDGILKARKYRDVVSKYGVRWLENAVEDGDLVYANFNITGALTGRMSCVSGDTILQTNRGAIRIDEYQIEQGDKIQTHTGNWKPILRHIYKGTEPMIRVECSNGSVVQCTKNHKLLTPSGWKKVGDLNINSEVISYVNQSVIHQQEREYRKGSVSISGRPTQTWIQGNSRGSWNELSQCYGNSSQVGGRGTKGSGKKSEMVKSEARLPESNVWQDWESSSQLYWGDFGWSWIHTGQERWQVCVGAPPRYGKCCWSRESAGLVGCSSYRWQQREQRLGQSGTGNKFGAQKITQETTTIRRLTPVGEMGVWDLEVAEDHSYCAGGLIHHNSSKPNLQQIPRRDFPMYRDFFIPNNDLILAPDVSQQEPRILGYLSKDDSLLKALNSGESIHVYVARMIYDDPTIVKSGSDPRYNVGKAINLAIGYGMTAVGLSEQTGLSETESQTVIDKYFHRFPGVKHYMTKYRNMAFRDGYVTTPAGRRMYVNTYDFKSENNAINSPIQGGAADFTKMWASMIYDKCKLLDVPFSLCMLVHDELVFDVKEEYKEQTIQIIGDAMQEVGEKLYPGIPFTSDMNQGKSWACHE